MVKKIKAAVRGQRLLAIILCVLLILALFPLTAQAWTNQPGEVVSSQYGSTIIGSDGQPFNVPSPWSAMRYNTDGTTEYVTWNGGGTYRYFLLIDGSGSSRMVLCAEAGREFDDSVNGYTSASGTNHHYFNSLPQTARIYIQLVTLYGWQPGKPLPISGINEADYYWASQVLCWEFQQQLRTGTGGRQSNGPVSANQFYNTLAGRPAEKAYNYILNQIKDHVNTPSWARTGLGEANTYKLLYNASTGLYSLTVTDTNNTLSDFAMMTTGTGVTMTRSGNKYTFTSSRMIETPVAIQVRKNVSIYGGPLLIWGRVGRQSMMTGANDPLSFWVKIETETYGWAKIMKSSEDNIVSGIPFVVTGNGVNKSIITGSDGTITDRLMPGTYTVTENAPVRYVQPASQTVTVRSGQTASVSFRNVLKKFRIEVVKRDREQGGAQGDGSLGSATYGLYNNGKLVDTFQTDSSGKFVSGYYTCGDTWTVKEISPSEGYLLDETVHKVGASPGLFTIDLNTVNMAVTEQVIKGNVRLIKHTDDWDPAIDPEDRDESGNTGMIEKPEAGAKFEIFLLSAGSYANAKESERDILVTNGDGMATSKDLPYGRYRVRQLEGEEGKAFIPDFTVFISQNSKCYSFILNNNTITGRVRVEKRDIETGEIIPAAGIGFQVRDKATGQMVVQRTWYPEPIDHDVYYTSDSGTLMMPEELPMGEYELIEVETCYGYVLDSTPVPFTIDGSDAVITVAKHNIAQKGHITVGKTGEHFVSVQENDGLYIPVYEEGPLAGTVFEIYADEDIYTLDGTLRVAHDELVATIETNEDGISRTEDPLYLGRYRVIEVEVTEGYVLESEPRYVELTYAGQEVDLTEAGTEYFNERQRVALSLEKSLETDALFGIDGTEELQAISFGLFAAAEIETADGTVIPADGLLEMISLDENGNGQFESDLPFGEYYIQECTTDIHYLLNDTKYPVVFEYEGQDTATVIIGANDGQPIENHLIRGSVEGSKVGEKGETLEGALIGLFFPDCTDFNEDNALLLSQSDEFGAFVFKDIPYGHWVIREVAPPIGHVLSDEAHHVYITGDGIKIEIRIENTRIRGDVQLQKVDHEKHDTMLEGAEFEIWADTNGNGKLDDEDKLIGPMVEIAKGMYQMQNLEYGDYFAVESKAPHGFKLDPTPLPFQIHVDGETVHVESVKGVGVTNKPIYSKLIIQKTSSDGAKQGFSFKITGTMAGGEKFEETFTTNEYGNIEAMLRVGNYYVEEIVDDVSRRYVLPEGIEFEIVADKDKVLAFHNVLKDTPQTSDDYSPWPRLAAILVALAGAGVCLWVAFKKTEDEEMTKDQTNGRRV